MWRMILHVATIEEVAVDKLTQLNQNQTKTLTERMFVTADCSCLSGFVFANMLVTSKVASTYTSSRSKISCAFYDQIVAVGSD